MTAATANEFVLRERLTDKEAAEKENQAKVRCVTCQWRGRKLDLLTDEFRELFWCPRCRELTWSFM